MSTHKFLALFDTTTVVGLCADCGATTSGASHVGRFVVSGACPGKVSTSHEWAFQAYAGAVFAACPRCGTVRHDRYNDMVNRSWPIDLDGECLA